MNKFLATVALSASSALAGPHFRGCPKDFSPMETFDVERYAGTWYEVARDKFTWFEIFSGCVVADYTLKDDGTIGVHNSSKRPLMGWSGGHGTAVAADTGDASLVVSFGE